MKSLSVNRKFSLPLVVIVVIITFSYCDKNSVTQPSFQSAFDQWQSNNLHDYTIDQKFTCFCVNSGVEVQVTVRADTVTNVIRISDGSTMPSTNYLSVDSLFAIIQNSTGDSLIVRYNAKYGYPEYLDVNPQLHPVDGGYLCETSNLHIP